MSAVRAVFLDVDGTLFSHRIHDIPPSALRTLYALREKGFLLFLATGRRKDALQALPLHGFPFDGYVTMTGHYCYDGEGQVLLREPLPPEDAASLVAEYARMQVPILLVHEDGASLNYADDMVLRLHGYAAARLPEIRPWDGREIFSAAAYCNREQAEELEKRLPGCRLSAWMDRGFDIISRSGGKPRGMQVFMDRYGLSREEVAAFGDADNDLEMLSFAGLGIAMGNATEKLKARADYITADIDEDGLLLAAEHFGWAKP